MGMRQGVKRIMMRRFLAVVVAASILNMSIIYPARAVLPALVLVEAAADFGAGLVVQTLARQAVLTVGVAANDASWVSMMSVAARAMGILRIVGTAGTFEIPLQADKDIPPVAPAAGVYGSQTNPLLGNDPSIRVVVNGTGANCGVPAGNSSDGQYHGVAAGEYSVSGFVTACSNLLAQFDPLNEDVWFLPGGVTSVTLPGGSPTYYYYAARIMISRDGIEEEMWTTAQGNARSLPISVNEPGDGVKRLKRSGDGFVADPADVDWTDAERSALAVPSRIRVVNAANDSAVNVVAAPGMTIIGAASKVDSANVRVRVAKLDAAAKPVSVTEETVAYADAGFAVADRTAAAAGSGSGSGTNTSSWPDDYARQATLSSVDAGISQLHKDLSDTSSVDDPHVPDSSGFLDSFFSGTFDGLKGWRLPSHTSTCPTAGFSWNSVSYVFDAHCQLVNDHFNALQAAMTVVWSLLALFIVMRA